MGVGFAVLAMPYLRGLRMPDRRTGILSLALVAVAGAVLWHFFAGSGPRFPVANNYHAVFAGIVKASENPDRVLQDLGVPEEHWQLPRRDIFSACVPFDHPVHRYLAGLSRVRLAGLYLREPVAVRQVLGEVQEKLARRRTTARGNFERSEARPQRGSYQPSWEYSRFRSAVLRPWPPLIWIVVGLGALGLGIAWARHRWDGRQVALLFLLLWFLTQVVVAVLGDGFVALDQHLVGARLALDFLFVVVLYQAFALLGSKLRPHLSWGAARCWRSQSRISSSASTA
jgi:hypothetical protein